MPLLSRVFKQPPVNGIYSYRIPGPGADDAGEAVESNGEADLSGNSEQLPEKSLSPPEPENEDNEAAMALAAEERIEDAVRQGYLEGKAEGKAEAEAASRELLEKASRKLKEAGEEARDCLQQARRRAREIVSASETDIVELAVAIAEKLIISQLELAPQKVTQIVRESMRRLADEEEQLEVYLHPADLPVCRKSLGGQFATAGAPGSRLELLPDERLSRGSCRIESESSTVEYLLDAELKKIRETLLEIASTKKQSESREEELAYAGS